MGKQSNDYNGFKAYEIDVSNPSRPSLKTTYTVGGGNKYDAVFPSTVADGAGNVFWVFFESNATTFVNPAIMVLANGTKYLQGPFLLNSPTASGTISTAGTDCSVRTNCASFAPPGSPTEVGVVVSGSFTGTLQFEDSKGASLTATPAGGGPTTAIRRPPARGRCQPRECRESGSERQRFPPASLPSIFRQLLDRLIHACRNANPPAFQGNFSSAQVDPSNPNNVWVYGVAAFSNVKCQWTTEAVQFTWH